MQGQGSRFFLVLINTLNFFKHHSRRGQAKSKNNWPSNWWTFLTNLILVSHGFGFPRGWNFRRRKKDGNGMVKSPENCASKFVTPKESILDWRLPTDRHCYVAMQLLNIVPWCASATSTSMLHTIEPTCRVWWSHFYFYALSWRSKDL